MIRCVLLICALSLLSSCIRPIVRPERAEIIFQSDQMQKFIHEVDRHRAAGKRVVIVFDIDDTMISAKGSLGTPPWFYSMVDIFRKKGFERSEAFAIMGAIDLKVQALIDVEPVEEATFSALRRWQKEGAIVVALTSRPDALKPVTKTQLENLAIEFAHPSFQCMEKNWSKHPGSFSEGVVYVGPNLTKEEAFDHFLINLERCGQKSDVLAHTDDQEKYVTQLKNSALKAKLSFIGQIYTKAIHQRKFSLQEANQELFDLMGRKKESIIPKEYFHIFF